MPAAPLAELADELGALVATTAQGVNVVPDHPFSLGIAGGFAHERAAELIHQADVVLVVGARLNQFTMRFGDSFGADADVVQIDVADAATHPRVDLYLRGDAATASADILSGLRLARGDGAVARTWRAGLPDLPGFDPRDRDPGTGLAADGRLDPRSVVPPWTDCCRPTASSSRTAATSSAGRPPTWSSPRRTTS